MKVYLRVKPLDSQEVEAGESKGYLEIRDLKTVLLQPLKRRWHSNGTSQQILSQSKLLNALHSHESLVGNKPRKSVRGNIFGCCK